MNKPQIIKSSIKNIHCGKGVKIMDPCNLYDCFLDDNLFVGPFVEVQSHSFICSLVTIGKNCFVGHGVMFINDTFSSGSPAKGNKDLWKPTHIGNNVSIGSNATIMPVSICDNVVISAGAVVTKDIKTSGIYAGVPVKKIK